MKHLALHLLNLTNPFFCATCGGQWPCRGAIAAERLSRVPNVEKTPRRTVRIPDELWTAAQAKAAAEERDVSDVIRKALERYVKRK